MSITIGEGIALYKAGRSLFQGVRQAFRNRPGGQQTQQIQAFRQALEQQRAALTNPADNPAAATNQTPNQQRIAATIAALESQLGKVFAEQPIDAARPATLELVDGRISVAGNHPDATRLEALFAERPDLERLVHRLDIALRSEPNAPGGTTTVTIDSKGVTAALR